jgi:phosphatidylglycerol lysyltransferase
MSPTITPGSLVRLVSKPVELASALPVLEPREVAAACDRLTPRDAAHVIAALPPQFAARVLDDESLSQFARVVEHLGTAFVAPLVDAMRPGRRHALLRTASPQERQRLHDHLDPVSRRDAAAAGSATGAAASTEAAPAAPHAVRPWLGAALAIVLATAALLTLRHALHALDYHQVLRAAAAIPRPRRWLALALTAAGYLVLAGYDLLALDYVGTRLPRRRVLFASFVAYALSQNVGFSALTGASVRYRFWSAWGLTAPEIAQGVAFTTTTFWLGLLGVGGAAVLAGAGALAGTSHLLAWRVAGFLSLVLVGGWLAWASSRHRVVGVGGWAFRAPGWRLALGQLCLSILDWLFAALVLRTLLPATIGIPLGAFVAMFVLAQVAGLVSHLPGGVGVFEATLVLLLRGAVPGAALAGALIAYRAIYYLLPLGVAIAAFAGYEARLRRQRVALALRRASRWVPATAPLVLSTTTFLAGLALLFSGATPSLRGRMHALGSSVPLGVVEAAHFSASIAGILLVLLARGVRQRLDAAWHVTLVVLGAGIAASLLKGLDYEEALLLAFAFALLASARPVFQRRAALFAEPLTAGWAAAVALALAATAWLGAFAYQHVDYSPQLWWHFALHGDAPRFLRAMVGTSVVAIAAATRLLIRPVPPAPATPSAEELRRTRQVIDTSAHVTANLALLGDKSLMFGEDGGFVMYGIAGRSWVALGDPVASSATARAELAWRFRAAAYREGGWPVFYQVTRDCLPLYVDLGLTILKLGENAYVPLEGFSLDGPGRRALRRGVREATKAGCTFEMVPADATRTLLPELKEVSDAWLSSRRVREKGFSLGRFDADYLSHFPVAVVRRGGRIVAFSNIWTTAGRQELSVDLMRHLPGAPPGTMDFLFASLMLWAAAEGYTRFDLGMAPLSGFEARALAPSWHRVARALSALGEHFYNFNGLRQYKEKFRPVWEPRYLAAPGGLHLPRVLANVTSLVAGGVVGIVSR